MTIALIQAAGAGRRAGRKVGVEQRDDRAYLDFPSS